MTYYIINISTSTNTHGKILLNSNNNNNSDIYAVEYDSLLCIYIIAIFDELITIKELSNI